MSQATRDRRSLAAFGRSAKRFEEERKQRQDRVPLRTFGKAPSTAPHVTKPGGMTLLELPDELLLQVALYLRPTQRLSNADGFSNQLPKRTDPHSFLPLLVSPYDLTSQSLVNLALTCKRLAPVAQEVMYQDVSLPQPRAQDDAKPSRAVSLLRTMIKRPDLASRVEHFAVWVWRGKPINASNEGMCACSDCIDILLKTVECIQKSPIAQREWTEHLKTPTEAMVSSLVFASLPKLKSVELYLKESYKDLGGAQYGWREHCLAEMNALDVRRLSDGLATTGFEALTLSTELYGMYVGSLPRVKTLTLEVPDDKRSRVASSDTYFPNVTTLKIRRPLDTPWIGNFQLRLALRNEISKTISTFTKVRTLKLGHDIPGGTCLIPPYVEKIIVRQAERYTVHWGREFLGHLPDSSKLRCIEMY